MNQFSFRVLPAIAGCLLIAAGALAAPFEKIIRFVQPDGTAIKLWGKGDEFCAVFETTDGYTAFFEPASKTYFYAALSQDGADLVPTELQIGKGDPAALGLAKHLRMSPKAAKAKAKKRFDRWDAGTKISERWRSRKAAVQAAESAAAGGQALLSPPTYTTTGTKVGLCLLIDFSDATATVSRAEIINFCNGNAYSGFNNNGSVKKYYQDVSGSLLTYTNVVTVYLRMAQPKAYYNDTSQDCGDQGNLLISDAVAILKALPNYATEIAPAFANLTLDDSGYVQACNVFYAGDDGGSWSYGLWPHSWSLYNVGPQTLTAGVAIYPYQITNIGDSLELGTFCHENGHMLCGYPDIYDYDYDSTGGAGDFCLMDTGGSGTNPVQVCAYLKRASGWATTINLTSASSLAASLSSSGAGFNTFYRYAKAGSTTEYYLLENRQRSGRDAGIPASGIAVWHIDELGDRDDQSLAFNTSHANYEVTLVQADNQWHFENYVNFGDSQDLYYSGNTASGYPNAFNDGSSPSARWWDGSFSGVNFKGFSASGAAMTFSVLPPALTISTPSPLPPGFAGVTYSQALASFGGASPYRWAVVSNALPAELTLSDAGVISGTPAAAGAFAFSVRVTDATNGTATATFSLTIYPPRSVPFEETFESGGGIPEGWSQVFVTNMVSWTFQEGSADAYPPSAHRGSYNACLFSKNRGNVTQLISPLLDLGASPEAPQLTFWHCMRYWSGDQDYLRVYYKTSASGPWNLLAEYTDSAPEWTPRVLDLPESSRTFFIAFEGVANYGYGVCIDDVKVTASVTAPIIVSGSPLPPGTLGVPYSHALAAIGGTAPLTWSVASGALPPGLVISAAGVISGTPSALSTASFGVRVAGGNGLASTNLFSLAVLPPRTLPYAESFENNGNLPGGWTQEHVSDAVDWLFLGASPDGIPSSAFSGDYLACFYSADAPVTKLISPMLDLGASPGSVRLSFLHCMAAYDGMQDELRVYYRASTNGAWRLLQEYADDTADWTERTVTVPVTNRYCFLAFEGSAYYGYGACIDDVLVSKVSPYTEWLTARFSTLEIAAGSLAGASDDPDGDGIPNLLEYAWGLEPWLADAAGLPAGGVWSQHLTLTYRQNKEASDLAYQVEASTNLLSSAWTTNNVSEVARADSNLWWQVTARHSVPVTNAPNRYLRLNVTLQ